MDPELQRLMAAMAFNAYRPSPQNEINLDAAHWSVADLVVSYRHAGDGFDATVFQSNTGQIVISFRGTDADSLGGVLTDADDDILIGKGERSAQVDRAIELVADIIALHPGADIQFTGHSLGGGLASLMAVFFDRPAYIFAPAPFEYSATDKRIQLGLPPPWLIGSSDVVEQYFVHYFRYQVSQGRRDSIDKSFQEYSNTLASDPVAGRNLFLSRESRVAGAYIQGECNPLIPRTA
jgi:putative lipase involved disintegration of autophagic bodies